MRNGSILLKVAWHRLALKPSLQNMVLSQINKVRQLVFTVSLASP